MQISRKDVGYAIYSRLEEALRYWIKEKLLALYGPDWPARIPQGIWTKVQENSTSLLPGATEDPLHLLDETDIPDLMEIVCFKNVFTDFVNTGSMDVREFRERMTKLYDVRCKIAHVKLNFSAIDLDSSSIMHENSGF